MSKVSVTFFGHTGAGKSTLVGYLFAHTAEEIDARWFEVNRLRLGSDYRRDRKYAYVVDAAKDEERRAPFKGTKAREGSPSSTEFQGTSLYFHISSLKINGKSFGVYDTPGAAGLYKQVHKGLYYGDIGVFVIEITKMLDWKWNHMTEIFGYLFTWLKLKDNKQQLIIVLSKMDLVDYSQHDFDRAVNIIKTATGLSDAVFVPTVIRISSHDNADATDVEENVLERSSKMPWYKGDCLITEIEKLAGTAETPTAEVNFAIVDKLFDNKHGPPGLIIRGKILKGGFEVKNRITVEPVLHREEWTSVSAEIQSIRIVGVNTQNRSHSAANHAPAGSYAELQVSGNVSTMRRDGSSERVKKADIRMPSGACIHSQNSVSRGAYLQVSVQNTEDVEIECLDRILLIWFGRTLSATVVSTRNHENKSVVVVQLARAPVVIPVDSHDIPIIKSFVAITKEGVAFRIDLEALSEEAHVVIEGLREEIILNDSLTRNDHVEHGCRSIYFNVDPKKFLESLKFKSDSHLQGRALRLRLTKSVSVQFSRELSDSFAGAL